MRNFRHLSKAQVREIVVSYNGGITQLELAKRFNIDRSTVSYHIKKYNEAYPEQGSFYSYVKLDVTKVCSHPSSKCTLCGIMWDQISNPQKELIAKLTKELEEARSLLRIYGH